jgi:import receptor subunit TOM22
MVQLEEVPDEELFAQQTGPKTEEEEDWDTSDGARTTH